MLGNFVRQICGCNGTWEFSSLIDREVESIRDASRLESRDLRPVRRGRFVGDGRPLVSCDRIAAFVHLCRQRPLAKRRGGRGQATASRTISKPICTWSTPASDFLSALAGVTDPQVKAEDHRPRLHRGLSQRSALDSQRAVPRAGDRLSGRDRIGGQPRWSRGDDQGSSQRRRVAGGARLRADRAVAGLVQRRSPQHGPRAGPAGGVDLAASVPRSGSGRALPGRGRANRAWRRFARPTAIVLDELQEVGPGSQGAAGVRGAVARAIRRRDGGWPHVRRRDRRASRADRPTS